MSSSTSIGSGSSNYTDSDATTKRVDNINDLYTIMQSILTGGCLELKSGDNIPTLNIPVN